jgi:hypothetical protein
VLGEEEDAADVGDFWVGFVGVVSELGVFGGLEGLVGGLKLLLFEMEVGEGYLDFCEAVGGFFFCEG